MTTANQGAKLVSAPALSVVLVFLVAGCGSTGPDVPDVSGTWDLNVTVTGGTTVPEGSQFTAVVTMNQSDGTLSGTWSVQGGGSGQLSGSVSGGSVSFTLTQDSPCPGSYSGSAEIAGGGDQLNGSYSGSDCAGTIQTTFNAVRR